MPTNEEIIKKYGGVKLGGDTATPTTSTSTQPSSPIGGSSSQEDIIKKYGGVKMEDNPLINKLQDAPDEQKPGIWGAIQHYGGKAMETLSGLQMGATKGVINSIRDYSSMGERAINKVLDPFGAPLEKTGAESLMPEKLSLNNTAEKIGSVGEAAAEFFLPVKGASTTKAAELAAEKAAGPFAKSFLPERAAEFAKEGITAPIGAMTKSPFLRGAESLLAKGPFGRAILEVSQKASTQVEDKISRAVDKMTSQTSLSQENIGKTVLDGLSDYEKNFKASSTKIYDAFEEMTKGTKTIPANTTTTIDVARKILAEQKDNLFKNMDPKIVDFLKRVTAKPSKQNFTAATTYPGKLDNFSFKTLKQTRTSVGEALAKDPSSSSLKRLYGALSDDMTKTVDKFYPEWGATLKKMNADYASGKQKIESKIVSSIENADPERIAANLVKKNSADALATVKGMIGPERFSEIGKSFLKTTFESSMKAGKFDVVALQKNLAKYDKETLSQMLSPTQLKTLQDTTKELEELQKLRGYLKEGSKISDGSQTAYLEQTARKFGEGGAFIMSLVTGNFPVAGALLGAAGAEFGAAKGFASEVGRLFLTKGLKAK